ncbi:zinc finger protein 57-like isoform X2 [Achroia grisella]|uniref:zinc finger protein 57-like isoform X2 n=1 Tax=Achroia grisella TaxID=688607 RepID=UPI0027D2C334|nr:zinc finger protein 57-like isoform X2 [Achroia grisella]
MGEIDINIEGYNVNGICVGCLNYNRKMFYSEEIKICFKIIANIDVPDGLSIQVCWECLAAVKAVGRFQAQILKSYDVLIEYSKQHTFLNSPVDITAFATTQLTVGVLDNISIEQSSTSEPDNDFNMDVDLKLEDKAFQDDPDFILKEEEYIEESHFSDNLSQEQDGTSDDDVQLSQLKTEKTRKKEKREKKGRKMKSKKEPDIKPSEVKPNHRKLKNLPEGLVEVYTMTEEEMWQIRSEDVTSKVFSKLKYKCDMCLIGFNTEKLMNDHMNGKHRPKGKKCHQCDVCQAYFLTKENVSAHRALHASAFRCCRCDIRTTLKRLMLRHALVHTGPQHQCGSCGVMFSTKSKLTYHRSICRRERPQCDCCGKVFANKMTLKYHLKLLPQNKDDKPKEKLYIPCKGCDKVFHSKKSYRSHVVIHEGVTYPCPTCGKLFQWKRNLARHARNHRERELGALHECRECNKSFSSRDCYNNHMRLSKRHVGEDAYVHECSYCGKKFATKWCMVDHIDWDHLKRIKYQCRVCFKAFKTAKIMVAHMNNIHEGKRDKVPDGEHLCEICGKSYKTVKRLKGHVWAMHTNRSTTKSFKCKQCPATFTWQTSIYKHVKIMHENKRSKLYQPRAQPPPAKKEEPYPGMDLANRMNYFQQNVTGNIGPIHPVPIIQNVV